MLETAVIGSNGLIGSQVVKFFRPTLTFNSGNIHLLPKHQYSKVIVAAPSGNRRQAEANPTADRTNINLLIDQLKQTPIETIVLIGTIDSIVYSDTHYGCNRKLLEDFVRSKFPDSYVLRLCTLIGPTIKKNVLYDLKHGQYLDSINLESTQQWYPLSSLEQDINRAISNKTRDLTLVSEPIKNKEIVDRFYPGRSIGVASGTPLCYNIAPVYFSKAEIFNEMAKYLK